MQRTVLAKSVLVVISLLIELGVLGNLAWAAESEGVVGGVALDQGLLEEMDEFLKQIAAARALQNADQETVKDLAIVAHVVMALRVQLGELVVPEALAIARGEGSPQLLAQAVAHAIPMIITAQEKVVGLRKYAFASHLESKWIAQRATQLTRLFSFLRQFSISAEHVTYDRLVARIRNNISTVRNAALIDGAKEVVGCATVGMGIYAWFAGSWKITGMVWPDQYSEQYNDQLFRAVAPLFAAIDLLLFEIYSLFGLEIAYEIYQKLSFGMYEPVLILGNLPDFENLAMIMGQFPSVFKEEGSLFKEKIIFADAEISTLWITFIPYAVIAIACIYTGFTLAPATTQAILDLKNPIRALAAKIKILQDKAETMSAFLETACERYAMVMMQATDNLVREMGAVNTDVSLAFTAYAGAAEKALATFTAEVEPLVKAVS